MMRISESAGPGSPRIAGFHEPDTGSIQYVVACPATGACAIVDPVQSLDPRSFATGMGPAEEMLDWIRAEGLSVEWVLDTHPHADHLSAAAWLKEQTGAPQATGAKVREIASIWNEIYGTEIDPSDHFDRLFEEGDTFRIGEMEVRVMLSPGHTLGSVTYVAGDAAMVHDTFMQPDAGTARCDFPGGSATEMWDTLQSILDLPEETRLFVGHDYCPPGRDEPEWEATVQEQRDHNKHVAGVTREDYIALREERDATLPLPARMLAALQVNLRGGRLPEDGLLRIPLNRF